MSLTTKQPTKLDYEQSIQGAYNDVNATLSVDGFLTGKVGHKVELAVSDEDLGSGETLNKEIYTFKDKVDGVYVVIYEITIIYTDSSRSQMVSAERTA